MSVSRLFAAFIILLTPAFAGNDASVPPSSAIVAHSGSAGWHDPSPHRVLFVNVEKNVRLEVLDWGGTGRPVILLAASGCTAHAYDEFAPKLTGQYHVYGITRRGYGASGYGASGDSADRLGDDVLAVMDALKIVRPILVGHSFAGEELSDVASRFPRRVAGLVYLEAAYTYAFHNDRSTTMAEFQDLLHGPEVPQPGPADLESFTALQSYYARVHGYRLPEAELRQDWETTPDGRVGKRRISPASATLIGGAKNFEHIGVPALVIFANPQSLGPYLDNSPDPAAKAQAAKTAAFIRKQADAVPISMPLARVVMIPHANHCIYMTNETDVLREIRPFMAKLR